MKTLFIVFLLFGAAHAQDVRIDGPQTMIYLGQRVSQVYLMAHPTEKITVTGRNTSATAPAFENSRNMILQTKAAGKALHARIIPVGIESLVVYVNQKNPIRELSMEQLRQIYLGKITNWRELGGRDTPIRLFSGESSTGTALYFDEAVLKGEEPYPFWGKSNTKELLETIAGEPDAIGYAALGVNPATAPVRIRTSKTSLAVLPTSDNIRNQTYPLSRPVEWIIPENATAKVLELCNWMLSSEGQLVIEGVGFQPLLPADRERARATLSLHRGANNGR